MIKLNKFYTQEEVQELAAKSSNPLFQLMCSFDTTKVKDPECTHYASHYLRYFQDLKDKPIRLLEIGVKEGQSVKMWKQFFNHPDTKIFGAEINPEPLKDFDEEGIELFYGDQADPRFLQEIFDKVGSVDIIIDDGGHEVHQQKTSFEFLFPTLLAKNGIYVIEDLGPSYWPKQYKDTGLRKDGTTIEYLKALADTINYRAWRGGRDSFVGYPDWSTIEPEVSYLEKHIVSLYMARSIAFIEKGNNVSV